MDNTIDIQSTLKEIQELDKKIQELTTSRRKLNSSVIDEEERIRKEEYYSTIHGKIFIYCSDYRKCFSNRMIQVIGCDDFTSPYNSCNISYIEITSTDYDGSKKITRAIDSYRVDSLLSKKEATEEEIEEFKKLLHSETESMITDFINTKIKP